MLNTTFRRALSLRSRILQSLNAGNLSSFVASRELEIYTSRNFSSSKALTSQAQSSQQTNTNNKNRKKVIMLTGSSLLILSSFTFLYPSFDQISLDSIRHIRSYSTQIENNKKSKSTSQDSNNITLLSETEVDSRLHANEKSFWVNRKNGIFRYDVAQLPSNNPIEDNHVEQIVTLNDSSEKDLSFFGIFDGHSGTFTSKKLSESMIQYVSNEISKLLNGNKKDDKNVTSELLDKSLTNGFVSLDNDIIYSSFKNLFNKPTKDNMLAALPAISGSCALLSVFNSVDKSLKVAVTGDSRALLGQIDPTTGNWIVDSLSIDQTGDNEDEVKRIRDEHPNEPNCIRNGRILGSLQPSRAFGDYRYKFKEVDGKSIEDLPEHLKIYFRAQPKNFLTPPYVTAKPEITTTNISKNSKFMVLGSDGLFELLSNEEIAGLVICWMEKNIPNSININHKEGQLPKVKDISTHPENQRPPFRYKHELKASDRSQYILKDDNVSTHLIRNALSAGGNPEYVSTLVSIPSPMSRRYRDDLTVTVVFFGDELPFTPEKASANTLIPNISATTQSEPIDNSALKPNL